VRSWQISRRHFEVGSQESFQDLIFTNSIPGFSRYLQAIHSSKTVAHCVTQTPEALVEKTSLSCMTRKPLSQKTDTSSLHQLKGLEMPEFIEVPRSATSSFRSCQSASSANTTWNSRWLLMAAAKYVLSQPCFRMPNSSAIALTQASGKAGRVLGRSKNTKEHGRSPLWRSSLASLYAALFIVMSYGVATAQTTTTTTLSVTPSTAAIGSVFEMTAVVTAGATPLTGGTVTFRDTFNFITQVLGTVQVQSGNGTAGNAILHKQLGGIGTHSIVATFNAPQTYLTSFATQSVSATGLYPTSASITATGGAGNWSLTTTIVGIGSLSLSPTGNVSLLDNSNSNYQLPGSPALLGTPGTIGLQTVAGVGSPITAGNTPLGVAVGDFNGDGFVDLAVLNNSDNTVSIFNGNGTGGFTTAPAATYATGKGPVAIIAGDFNGDGNLDLAVANGTDGTISILLGKSSGNGTFNPQVTYSLPGISLKITTPTALTVGDFNGDGIPDLAVAQSATTLALLPTNGSVAVMLGDGTGAFPIANGTQVTVGNSPSSVIASDFNGDGNLDFAVANETDNTISVMKGNGSGITFTAATFSTFAGTSPSAIAVGDFNGDGQPDLAVAESGKKKVDIYKGNGDGTFALLSSPATGNDPVSVVVGDFNADGKLDFAVTNKTDGTTTIMLGNGSGTVFTAATGSPFLTGTGTATKPAAIATADFNGDGSADLAVANSATKNVGILLNQVTDTATVLFSNISIPGGGPSTRGPPPPPPPHTK